MMAAIQIVLGTMVDTITNSVFTQILLLSSVGMFSLCTAMEIMHKRREKKKLKLETFQKDGTGEFILLADDCLYDSAERRAASAGPLEMKTADGRFFTEGEGFLWQERESILTISNRVHTVIRIGPAGAPKS